MSKTRQLSKEEKQLTEHNLEILKDDLAYMHAMSRQNHMAIEIAPIVYKRQLNELKKKGLELDNYIEQLEFSIKTAQDQIKNGVTVKDVESKDSK